MSAVSNIFSSKPKQPKTVTSTARPLSPIPEDRAVPNRPFRKVQPQAKPETTKAKLVEKAKEVVKKVVHDAVSDSDTESYYDDADNLEGSGSGSVDEDGDPTKHTMVRAVKKVGSKNVELNAELKELRAELKAATSMIAKLQTTVDSAAASKEQKKKAAADLKKAEALASDTAKKLEAKADKIEETKKDE